jgi:hypothetical protein
MHQETPKNHSLIPFDRLSNIGNRTVLCGLPFALAFVLGGRDFQACELSLGAKKGARMSANR